MTRKLKRKFFIFLGMIVVIAALAALATSWFYDMRIEKIKKAFAFEIDQQGLLLKDHGKALKNLASVISAYARTQQCSAPNSIEQQKLQQYAQEIDKHGEELNRYGSKLVSKVQQKNPLGALLDISDIQAFIPEDVNKIDQEKKKVDGLQMLVLKYRSRIQAMEYELAACRMDKSAALKKLEARQPTAD